MTKEQLPQPLGQVMDLPEKYPAVHRQPSRMNHREIILFATNEIKQY
jgi:hypothetical protein